MTTACVAFASDRSVQSSTSEEQYSSIYEEPLIYRTANRHVRCICDFYFQTLIHLL